MVESFKEFHGASFRFDSSPSHSNQLIEKVLSLILGKDFFQTRFYFNPSLKDNRNRLKVMYSFQFFKLVSLHGVEPRSANPKAKLFETLFVPKNLIQTKYYSQPINKHSGNFSCTLFSNFLSVGSCSCQKLITSVA